MTHHWLCVGVVNPFTPPSPLHPAVVPIAKDESTIAVEPADGQITQVSKVRCTTHRLAADRSRWVDTQHFDHEDDYTALVTDARFVVFCHRYALPDQGVRLATAATLFLSATKRSWDTSLMTGHIRWDWVKGVFARGHVLTESTPRYAREPGLLQFLVERPAELGGSNLMLEITLPWEVDHRVIAHDIAVRVARHRLATRTDLSDAERTEVAAAPDQPAHSGSEIEPWVKYQLRHALQVGFLPTAHT